MPAVRIKRKKATGFENVEEVIQIRPPMAKDLYGLDFIAGGLLESIGKLVARCSNLTQQEVDELDSSEFMKLVDEMNKYISGQA
jgi:hypothetical protein